jgi:hypothetical protein
VITLPCHGFGQLGARCEQFLQFAQLFVDRVVPCEAGGALELSDERIERAVLMIWRAEIAQPHMRLAFDGLRQRRAPSPAQDKIDYWSPPVRLSTAINSDYVKERPEISRAEEGQNRCSQHRFGPFSDWSGAGLARPDHKFQRLGRTPGYIAQWT